MSPQPESPTSQKSNQTINLLTKMRSPKSSQTSITSSREHSGTTTTINSSVSSDKSYPLISLLPDLIELKDLTFDSCSEVSFDTSLLSSITEKPSISKASRWRVDNWRPIRSTKYHRNEDVVNLEEGKVAEDPTNPISEVILPVTTVNSIRNVIGEPDHTTSIIDKEDYIIRWKGKIPPSSPRKMIRNIEDDLRNQVDELNEGIRYLNQYTDQLVSSSSTILITRCLCRLCGVFSPSSEFFSVLGTLAYATGTRRSHELLQDSTLLDEAMSRAIRVIMKPYDDTTPINTNTESSRAKEFVPPDCLWVLIQTCDIHILGSLEKIIELSIKSTRKLTQRSIILNLLLNRLRYPISGQGEYSRDSFNFQYWAKSQSVNFAKNFWLLDKDYSSIAHQSCRNLNLKNSKLGNLGVGLGVITRVTPDEVRLVIDIEKSKLHRTFQEVKGKREREYSLEDSDWEEGEIQLYPSRCDYMDVDSQVTKRVRT